MIVASVRIIYNNIPKCGALLRTETDQGSREFGDKLLADIKARAPVRTGALRDGMYLNPISGMAAFHVGIGSREDYWKFLEFGTRHMSARPFIGPAVQAGLPELKATMTKHIIEAVLKSAGPAVVG